MKDILWFKDVSKKDVDLVGGKGANLGEMFSANFPIPTGFFVSAGAYKKFIESTGIDKKIYSILDSLNVDDSNELHSASEKVQDIILNAEIPPALKHSIQESYNNMNVDIDVFKKAGKKALDIIKAGRDIPYVAVRSSATAEDLPSIDENSHVLIKVNGIPAYDTIKNIYNKFGDGTNCLIEVAAMQDNEVKWVRAEQIYKHPAKNKKLFKITTETGREITITENHSLIILDKNTLKPKTACIKELKKDEMVPVTRRINLLNLDYKEIDVLDYVKGEDVVCENNLVFIKNKSSNWKIQNPLQRKIIIDNELAYFLGLYCAEGSTHKNNCVIITNPNKDIMNRIKRFLTKLSLYDKQKINKHSIRIYCKSLVRLLHQLTGQPLQFKGKGKSCKIKGVPNFIFGCSKDIIGSFLAGCYDGDGCILKSGVEYYSTSKKLIGGIVKLLEMLEIDFYIRKKKCGKAISFNINIPCSQAKKFDKLVMLENSVKLGRLNKLIKEYGEKENHPEILNPVLISDDLSKNIKMDFDSNLAKTDVEIGICPLCDKKTGKSSYYKNKLRFYCRECKKAFYESDVNKKLVAKYIYYDERGKFVKGMVPWNKGLIKKKRLFKNKFRQLMDIYGLNEYTKFLNGSVLWDRIKKVEEIKYNGDVYDFTVPEIENFAAGIGGIITHNTASFAGQQATYLNVRGKEDLVKSVQKCWASLFTARAIYYRVKNKFPHEKVFISVVVQRMVNSDKAGVIFSINPTTNTDEILIEAGFGLGETVVAGSITPDKYIVDKKTFEITDKQISMQNFSIIRDINLGRNIKKTLGEEGRQQKLTDEEIKKLAKMAIDIEAHYQKPQDIEFAIESGRIYIVQSRPITTIEKVAEEIKSAEEGEVIEHGKEILKGFGASPKVGTGAVKFVRSLDELGKIEQGDVLVAEMTNPDYVSAMKKANAIVTEKGGISCHAAIVGREMGLAVVVGAEGAMEKLKEGQIVTVDGSKGVVYAGKVEVETKEEKQEEEIEEKLEEMGVEKGEKVKTVTEIKVIVDLPDLAEKAASTEADGVGLLRAEFMVLHKNKIHPVHMIDTGRKQDLVDMLSEDMLLIAKQFKNKPVWYRTLDAPTDEFRHLEGGEDEPEEDNPMMGWRSIRRDLDQPQLLKSQFEAIKKVHDAGYTNIGVMLPLVTHVSQVAEAKKIMKEVGLEPLEEIEFGIMVETPASVEIIEELCKEGIDFISIGSNDLTQFTLAVDRNNAKVQKLFDEMHPAVLSKIKRVIKVCKENNVETSICGQAGSRPEMAEFLVKCGIDSISANIDAVEKIRKIVYMAEKRLLLKVARNGFK